MQFDEQEEELLKQATTFSELTDIAFRIIERMQKPIVQVCGPMTTGGEGDIEKNFAAFKQTVAHLRTNGCNVLDQVPFDEAIQRIINSRKKQGYPYDLLEEFCLPIFESEHVTTLYFLPGWQSSTGTSWEHEQAQRLEITIIYMPENWRERTDYI